MSRSLMYIVGMLIVAAGLAYAAMLLGVPTIWIGVGVLVLMGIGIAAAASNTPTHHVVDDTGKRTEIHHHHVH